MNAKWYRYLIYNHIKHFWSNSIVDRLNRHGIHWITFSDERIRHYAGRSIISKHELNQKIADKIENGKPFLVSRLGGSETKYITAYTKGKEVQKEKAVRQLAQLSGFFPVDTKSGDRFAQIYFDAIHQIDICGIWRFFMEDYFVDTEAPNAELSILEWLEPWRSENGDIPWSHSLKGKKVLVIHPFADSIRNQYETKREQIFKNQYEAECILPRFNLQVMKSVQSLGGSDEDGLYETWFDALDAMTEQVKQYDFDIAIVGCGAYGLPLAARIKQMGKQAIHLGGATQLMFGIMGKRWEAHPEIMALQNEAWIRPQKVETPRVAGQIENGCYW